MDISVVTTLYYSAPFIEEFYTRICAEIEKVTESYEIIFVNDGSPDNSLELVMFLHKKDPKVKIIDLSRNFGHAIAMLTGIAHAKGEYIFLIDCDLEEEPELFSKFHKKIKQTGSDVVYGVQNKRKGKFFERVSGGIFWNALRFLSSYPIPKNQTTIRLMSRRYVDSLMKYNECEVFLPGLWAITGFEQIPLKIKKYSRGSSSYTFKKKIIELVNAVTSFSSVPLVFIFYIGAIIAGLSSIAALYLIIRRIFFRIYLSGWPSLIVSIWLLGGLTIFCIGLIGIYLSKIFMESKRRPKAIIRRIYEHKNL